MACLLLFVMLEFCRTKWTFVVPRLRSRFSYTHTTGPRENQLWETDLLYFTSVFLSPSSSRALGVRFPFTDPLPRCLPVSPNSR